ncbi:MAG: hypothetical protein Kow0059_22920 [Candidatus Sumerlaeia bacterium]
MSATEPRADRIDFARVSHPLRSGWCNGLAGAAPAAALGGWTAVCLLVFHPHTANSNLIKEMLWWPGLLVLAGLGVLVCPWSAVRRRVGGVLFPADQRGPARLIPVLWGLLGFWLIGEAIRSPDTARGWVVAGRFVGFLATAAAAAAGLRDARSRRLFLTILTWTLAAASAYTIAQGMGSDFIRWADRRRPPGTFGNPNFMANLLGAWWPLVVVWELWGRRPNVDGDGPEDRRDMTLPRPSWRAVPVRAGLMLVALVFTQSRAGLVSVTTGTVGLAGVMWALRGRAALRIVGRLALLGVLGGEVVFGLVQWLAPARLDHLLNSVTVQIRFGLWRNALQFWRESPMLGHGAGAFAVLAPRLSFRLEPIAGFKQAIHAHSWFFESLVELGAGGTLLLAAALAALLHRLWKAVASPRLSLEQRLIAGASGAGLAALLAGTLFDVWLNWWDGGWTFALVAGVGLAASRPAEAGAGPQIGAAGPARNGKSGESAHGKGLLGVPMRWAAKSARPTAGCVLLAAGLVAGWMAWNFWHSERDLRLGRALLDSGQPAPALHLIERALERHPSAPDAPFYRALALMNLRRPAEVESALTALIAARPFAPAPVNLLARHYLALGRPAEAEAAQRRAWALEPGARQALDLAQILLSAGRPMPAAAVLEEQLNRQIHPEVLHLYLKIERESGRPRRARDFLAALRRDTTLKVHPGSRAELARWEAELSALMGDPIRALTAYQEALTLDPGNFELWNDYGLTLKALHNFRRAAAAFDRAMALAPMHFAPVMNRLELAIAQGDEELARRLSGALWSMDLPPAVGERLKALESGSADRPPEP